MNSTQQNEFPVLKEMLLIEVDGDITSGLRQIATDIAAMWNSNRDQVKKVQKGKLKKLGATQLARIQSAFENTIRRYFANPTLGIDTSTIENVVNDKAEATVVVLTAMLLAESAEEINAGFIKLAQNSNIITPKELTEFLAINSNTTVYPLSAEQKSFIDQHLRIFEQIFTLDADIDFKKSYSIDKLNDGINATPPDKQKQAVLGVFYMLKRLRGDLRAAGKKMEASMKGKPAAPAAETEAK